mmetsp:Transcript_71242/g.87389  ORF Transcript_71242/g.87389 Transcript_71242/m.87389 type:complete len:428 (-) Transcript_71242:1030-2313(-)
MSLILGIISCILISLVNSVDNGLGLKPPLGWRSWNAYHGGINQDLIVKCIDAVTDTSRLVDGVPTSLADLGYNRVGVDDNWQTCDSNGNYFHNDTAPNGWAVINNSTFPNVTALVEYAHNKNVLIGWYFNNCICRENNTYPANEVNDVNFLRMYDFDGVKLDGCGTSHNISNWQHLINITGTKPLLTENCHNEPNTPNATWCPFNFFRSSNDINTNYQDVIGDNLQSTKAYQQYPTGFLSRPGCWAYPDMLEVGNFPPQLNASVEDMDQSHFSAWAVVSSPLILGFDLTNENIINRVWPVITNKEVLNVSQSWGGHPGRQIKAASYNFTYQSPKQHFNKKGELSAPSATISGYEIWAKPQPNGKYAVLLLNNDGYNSHDITVDFSDIPFKSPANIRDIVNKQDLGIYSDSYTSPNIPPFGSAFLLFS